MTKNDTSSSHSLPSQEGPQTRYTFKKSEKLCYRRSFDILFTHKKSFNCGSLWVVYFFDLPAELVTHPAMAAFAVPKRRFKRAVVRNRLKRRLREAYRLHKSPLLNSLRQGDRNLSFLFKFNGRFEKPFHDIEADMLRALEKLESMI